jgi:8-hydroxy-5-deazaflavin:NADPH oxidoreductase
VVGRIKTLGLTGYYAGPLANSAATEALTSLLIQINRQFGCQAGIRITGIK